MKTPLGRPVRMLGALLALVVALCCAGIGVASAAEGSSIELGADEPTTTITVDGAPIELIPATSYELPPESTASAPVESTASAVSQASESIAASSGSDSGSGIEVQGVSSSTDTTSAADVGGSATVVWFVIGAVVVLGAAVSWMVRARRAARH